LRLAIVGYGYWGSKHVRVLTAIPDVDVTVVDNDPSRLASAALAFPTVRLAPTLDEVLPSTDAVLIATPPRTHARLALTTVRAGRHVFVEKPLATSVWECEALVDAADRAGVLLMAGHTFEYNTAVWKLRDIVQSGELGHVCYIDTARLNLGLYQLDVNVLWDLAPHDISIVNFLLGRSPERVSAWGNSHASGRTEDVAHLQLRYLDVDVTAYMHVSWLDPCKVRRVTVVGTEKMVVYNDLSPNERIRIYDSGVEPSSMSDSMHALPMNYRWGDIVSPFVSFEEPLAVQDAHLIDCIRTGARPRTDGASGLAVVRVLEAADKALRSGHEIALDDHSRFNGVAICGVRSTVPALPSLADTRVPG
jgi:predicted dehydrogenase